MADRISGFLSIGFSSWPTVRSRISQLSPTETFCSDTQVLKYSDLQVPQKFGNTFLVHYDLEGKVVGQLRLAVNTNDFEPTGFAVLRDGQSLVVGRAYASTKLRVLAQVFRATVDSSHGWISDERGRKLQKQGASQVRGSFGRRLSKQATPYMFCVGPQQSLYTNSPMRANCSGQFH